MDEQSARNEQEREQYYGERYEAVLEELRQVRGDYQTIIKNQESHDKRFDDMDQRFGDIDQRFGDIDQRFDEMDKGIEAVKAASETAHKEILTRLERIESRLD